MNPEIRGKAYGFHRAMDHAGAVLGPLLTLFALFVFFSLQGQQQDKGTVESGMRFAFAMSIIPGVLALLTIVFFIKEKKTEGEKRPR